LNYKSILFLSSILNYAFNFNFGQGGLNRLSNWVVNILEVKATDWWEMKAKLTDSLTDFASNPLWCSEAIIRESFRQLKLFHLEHPVNAGELISGLEPAHASITVLLRSYVRSILETLLILHPSMRPSFSPPLQRVRKKKKMD
jgi:hypothetical protein